MRIDLSIRDINYAKTVLYWTVEKDINEDVNKFNYIVQISESPNGPWQDLFTPGIYAFGYIDTTTQRGMIDQRIYYRIQAINEIDGSKFYSSSVISINNESNYISNYIAEQEQLLLRRFNGREVLLFARRKFGNRCPDCYSDIDRKVTKSKCSSCFGTTYEGGFFAPIKIFIQADPKSESVDKNDYQVQEQEMLTCWTSNEIVLASGDMIVTLKNTIQRYEIVRVTPTSLHDNLVRQILVLNLLRADRPEQLLTVDSSMYILDEFNVFRKTWRQGW